MHKMSCGGLVALLVVVSACARDGQAPTGAGEDWATYLGDKATTHY